VGDRQAAEGFYTITPELMNPNSNYYLVINTGFPNSFDKANDRDGTFLMIHGDCWSSGCYAMTDEQMAEIYSLARDSLLGWPSFQIQAYPFRMTPANLARHRTNPNMAFWKMLKIGNDHFEATHVEPKVDFCDRRYVFDANQTPNSSKPLVFDPTGKCRAFVVNPKIARPALEKQHADEVEYAQLVKDNVSVAPIYSGLDGGMNKVFLARFPGRIVPLAIVLPTGDLDLPQLPPVPWADNDGSLPSRFFGALFQSKPTAQTQVASTDSRTQESATSATNASSATPATKPAPAD
jgi:murein L,D-transpeptidase YafK